MKITALDEEEIVNVIKKLKDGKAMPYQQNI